ncbi:MAG: FtsX-like permease family protein [Spirochaetes bacterium]|jgi:ABC-type lipoprotein release transport system permease subunit|nr:FtsX-like permease family protein [Spirochaetota bacterium]
MRLILSLGFRNLLRQKRRSFFLGTAICFGMMILVLTNSFSHGISDTLLNRVVVYMTGHMSLTGMEDGSRNRRIIRDKKRFMDLIKTNVRGINKVWEAVGVFARVIGNAKGDNAILVCLEVDDEFAEYFAQNLVAGSLKDFQSGKVENPVILYSDKAKTLGVKLGDVLKARMQTVTGQRQSARLTVVAIIRSNNLFEGTAMFVSLKDIKNLLGMKPHETGALYVSFKKINDPAVAISEADRLHRLLVPGVVSIYGEASNRNNAAGTTALGFSRDDKSMDLIKKGLAVEGKMPDENSEKDVLASRGMASALRLKPGSAVVYRYKNKYEGAVTENKYRVSGVFSSRDIPEGNIMLLNEKTFFKTYLSNLPEDAGKHAGAYVPKKASGLYPAFCTEWKLLPRTSTNDELRAKLAEMTRTKWKGPWFDVGTMYETADFILTLESALNLVALVAVLILFFIILIGVLNTLRMTIRERTREIGTVRAIGMQKKDVKRLFISETMILTAIACLAGILLAFILMGVMRLFTINTDSVFSILLVDRRLYFLPTAGSIISNFILIIIMAAVTAYFPAKRASNLSAVEALRHFE